MRSALADPRRGTSSLVRRRARALGVVALLCATVLTGCSGNTSITPPKASHDSTDARVDEAQQTIAALDTALRDGDSAKAAALGTSSAQQLLTAAADNVRRLDLTEVSLHYVEDIPASTVDGAGFGPDSWQATVAVSYRVKGWDPSATHVETTFTFAPGGGGQQIAAIGGGSGRTPLWLAGPVTPIARGRTLVLSRTGANPRDSALAQQAIKDVDKVLTHWQGKLVLEAPATEQEFDAALAAPQSQYANIAAVTASVDGSLVPTAPVHVFLNPSVFDGLGHKGAQVVISHESTHVATKATFATMPTWLLEGFADYVALAHAGVPVQRAASQILARIKATGIPKQLPSDDDLSPTADGLGATYEEAWLANRFLSREYGEAKLIAFYEAVSGGTKIDAAFADVLHTTQAAFTKKWRADLRALSGGLAG